MTQQMDQRRGGFTLTLLLVLVTSAFSYVAGAFGLFPWVNQQISSFAPTKSISPAAVQGLDMKRLQPVLNAIQSQYVDTVTGEKLTEGVLKGLVGSLGDPYSTYFTADEFKRFNERLDASFTGIGVHVELSQRTGLVTVVAPIKHSPGEKAGLRSGDAVLKVDGQEMVGKELEAVVKLIRGPKGTKVTLTIQREGQTDPLEFTVTRDTIVMPSVDAKIIDQASGVGYLQFFEFTKGSGKQVQAAINDLKAKGMTRLILDLRQNPGGLLNEAVDVASLFVPANQPVVHILERGAEPRVHKSSGNNPLNMPLVVLVDGGSASAAEILAGAIKDLNRGTLMGVKTFGKGSVQSIWELPGGAGIKLTTAKWLTANQKPINGVGIDPHIVVENPNKVIPGNPGDPQLEAALKQIKTMKP